MLFAIEMCWKREKSIFSNRVSLCVSTTFQGKMSAQEIPCIFAYFCLLWLFGFFFFEGGDNKNVSDREMGRIFEELREEKINILLIYCVKKLIKRKSQTCPSFHSILWFSRLDKNINLFSSRMWYKASSKVCSDWNKGVNMIS